MKCCPVCNNFFSDDIIFCPLDDSYLEIQLDPFLGKIIGGCYRIVSQIARGGIGTIYLAKHRYLDREVAIKILKPSISKDEEMRKRIVREAKICASMEHPYIVKVFDLVTFEGSVCIIMEKLEGISLKDELKEKGIFPVDRVSRILGMVAEALSRAHSLNIIHRDIKPGNIFLVKPCEKSEYVKLLDFGIAFTIGGTRLTREGMLIGTPSYISPELIKGEEPTKASDIYSLGCVMYEILTGKNPFLFEKLEDTLKAQLLKKPEPPNMVRVDIPQTFSDLILKMLEKEPEKRYQDASELLEELYSKEIVKREEEISSRRSSEQAEIAQVRSEIEWGKFFMSLASSADEDTSQTIEFINGLNAARELAILQEKMKKIYSEMENIESKKRQYYKNIGKAIDNLEQDLMVARRELERQKMQHISVNSQKDYLNHQIKNLLKRLLETVGKKLESDSQIDEEEIKIINETWEKTKEYEENREKEKDYKNIKENLKAHIADLKYQIAELGKRLQEVEIEYSELYEKYRNEIEQIAAEEEKLKNIAALSARKVKDLLSTDTNINFNCIKR